MLQNYWHLSTASLIGEFSIQIGCLASIQKASVYLSIIDTQVYHKSNGLSEIADSGVSIEIKISDYLINGRISASMSVHCMSLDKKSLYTILRDLEKFTDSRKPQLWI